ncbi:putative beta-lysine N-acetyltransferase [Alteribacter lacisalsi]|uniref:Putative beta-lysine N-acetyltransferase n=1 Tax=Alteribacter lacisalsi TaxID=2045244 RepID=A0A2W0HMP1_9BACI|nr:putative beta-lysine N-acetyltransferase [Alteribacter lacisalsi]PYZ98342.1 putative beta-lysine N-acetyltransferase [Alteribacter lacisalsi]
MRGGVFIFKNQWEDDQKNDRLVAWLPDFTEEDLIKLRQDLDHHERGKRIVYIKESGHSGLLGLDFREEAVSSGFFSGDKAYIYTHYGKEERSKSKSEKENSEVLAKVKADRKKITAGERAPFPVSLAGDSDLLSLASLYRMVFPEYPTNIFEPEALKKSIESDYTFAVMKDGDEVIGAASAMDTGYGSAEITDCAVNPAYRGQAILNFIIQKLEEQCVRCGINHVFSMTRARSTGMNMTVKRLEYIYEGTLINNCVITSGFEDMNMWTKNLKK